MNYALHTRKSEIIAIIFVNFTKNECLKLYIDTYQTTAIHSITWFQTSFEAYGLASTKFGRPTLFSI
jgi:hypothetical protein